MRAASLVLVLFASCAATEPLPAPVPAPSNAQQQAMPAADSTEDRATLEACELHDDANACMRAGAKNTVVGRALLYHGCMTGSRAACQTLRAREVTQGERSDADARADVDRALLLGCAQGKDAACSLAGSFSDGREEATLSVENAAREVSHTEQANSQEQCLGRCAGYYGECTRSGQGACAAAKETCDKACEPADGAK